MDAFEELNRRGTALLAELAANPESECWRQFDALFYEIVWRWIRANHATMAARVARYLQVEWIGGVDILPEEVDEVLTRPQKLRFSGCGKMPRVSTRTEVRRSSGS